MGVRFATRIIDSLSSPLQAETSDTWLGQTPGWIEYFGLTISVHHGTTTEPLGLVGFEVAFRNAWEAVGRTVDDPGSATQHFVDMTVQTDDDGERKLSLKSTAAKSLSAATAHISKLTEAAWIQDVRSAKTRRDHTLDLFRQYRSAVDSIIMTRAFRPDRTAVPTKYQLLEIPTEIFASLEHAPLEAFAADGPTSIAPTKATPLPPASPSTAPTPKSPSNKSNSQPAPSMPNGTWAPRTATAPGRL